nr:MAG TPA: hypothetical protein [Caudoviricetes sp.]
MGKVVTLYKVATIYFVCRYIWFICSESRYISRPKLILHHLGYSLLFP